MIGRNDDPKDPTEAIAMLTADHQKVRDLFAQYEATSHKAAKWTIAEAVCRELERHAALEEQVFYPAVEVDADMQGKVLVEASFEAHQIVKNLIGELRDMRPETVGFEAKFHRLIRHVEHHVEEEETALFPLAEQHLANRLDEVAADLQELKRQLPA
jgi:hemerythrin-like domain-containing protein